MYLETERMTVRDFAMDDLEDLQAILGDEETMAYSEPTYTRERTAEFLRQFCVEKKGAVAAVLKATGRVIGYILVPEIDEGVYEMGWFFNRTCWGNGYALEACKAVVDHAFNQQNAHKIFAETIDGGKSVGLMKKLGMKPEGIRRSQVKDRSGTWADLYLYGLLAEDR